MLGFERSRGRRGQMLTGALAASLMLISAQSARAQSCTGDCDGNGEVTVDEIVTMVNAALTGGDGGCPAGDANDSGDITVDEIITAVNNALTGCTPPPSGVCGNNTVEGDEQCDNGGFCVGGNNAGTACTSEGDCQGTGVCDGGANTGHTCSSNTDCPDSICIHCRPVGGDGCAANCTTETQIAFDLVPGVQEGADNLQEGTSGVIVYSSFLNIPLPLEGALVATVGKERGGVVPMVVRAEDIQFPAIPVLSLACACVGGAPAKTCGGVVFDETGGLAEDCTTDESACNGKLPCAYLHGPGNTISGIIGCDGLNATNLNAVLENGDTVVTLAGAGPSGSALVVASINIRIVLGACTGTGGDYGADGQFCTADDPPTDLTVVGTGPATTGQACGTVKGDSPEFDVGPACRQGSPASCNQDGTGDISGMCLVTAFPFGDVEQLGDLVGTITLCAE